MAYLQLIKNFGQAFVILTLIFTCVIVYARLQRANANIDAFKSQLAICSNHLQAQNAAIMQLKLASDEQAVRVKESTAQAKKYREKAHKERLELEKAVVPARCEEAIKWGVKKANEIIS